MARSYSYRVDAYKNGGRLCTLACMGAPSISCNASAPIKTSMSLTCKPEPRFDPLKDEVRAFQIIDGVEAPAGVFIVGAWTELLSGGSRSLQLECYDRAHLLQLNRLETVLHLDAGVKYLEAVKQLLTAAGISLYIETPSDLALATAREDWDIGTDLLTIINDLLAEINYTDLWFDPSGTAMLTPKQIPSVDLIRHRINGLIPGSAQLRPDMSRSTDVFDAPNVFRVVCANPDLPAPLVATVENNSTLSPASIINRGRRILEVYNVDNVPDLDTLQSIAQQIAFEHMSVTESVEIMTANLPGVRPLDVVALQSSELSGLYQVTGYTMTLGIGESMRITLRRSVLV